MISELKELFSEWIAAVTRAVHAIVGRFVPQQKISLTEGDDNVFTARMAPGRKGGALPDVLFQLSGATPDPALPADWKAALC
ncbi:MAG TPA: hypothetical protein VGF36_07630, partial [Rhodopila sp.]